MGLIFVLIFWATAGVVLGSIGAGALAGIAWLLTRGVAQDRQKLIRAAAWLPFACLAWAAVIFVFQASVNAGLLHRDIGLGDSWHAPLPNGYQVSFIDITDQGTLCPIAQGDGCNSASSTGVRSLQVAGPYLLGASDSQWFQHFGHETSPVDQYFILDTRDGKRTSFSSPDQLRREAAGRGLSVHLEPIYFVYFRYRYTWFDILAGCLLVLPPIGALCALLFWMMRLRRSRVAVANA